MNSGDKYVLVGVTRARERWSSDLARWSTSGAAPLEFVRCLSAEEAHAVLGTGRRASALLLDARGAGVDRDLIDAARAADIPTIVLTDGTVHRDWDALGCAAVIDNQLEPASFLDVLGRHCAPVDRTRRPGRSRLRAQANGRSADVVAVLGRGGTGTSTVAMALSQSLASNGDRDVVLVDGARRGDLAMYHHIGDVIPGLPELVEAHRSDRLDPAEVRRLTFRIERRGYSLLLGRRRVAEWVTLRRQALGAALDALSRTFDSVVLDLDADHDGQHDTGSADAEDRHSLTIASLDAADLVLVVGRAGLQGTHALVGLIEEVVAHGVPAHRVVPVLVGAGHVPAGRASIAASIAQLVPVGDQERVRPVLHLRNVRRLDDVHHTVELLPDSLCRPLGRAVTALIDEAGPRPSSNGDPQRVRPGELGSTLDVTPYDLATPRDEVA